MSSVSKVAALLSSWALFFSLSTLSVWSQTDDRAKLVEGAKKEGKLIWYTSTNVTESKPLLDDLKSSIPLSKARSSGPAAKKHSIELSLKREWDARSSIS